MVVAFTYQEDNKNKFGKHFVHMKLSFVQFSILCYFRKLPVKYMDGFFKPLLFLPD